MKTATDEKKSREMTKYIMSWDQKKKIYKN